MLKYQISIIVFILLPFILFSQSTAITIDGVFDDWNTSLATYTDVSESIQGVDITEIQATNDENFLYIKIKASSEFDLTDTTIPQSLVLFLDTDNNPATGFNAQTGYGTELGIIFNELFAHFNTTPYSQVGFSDLSLRIAPTVSSDEFEIAIKRDAIPDGTNALFTSNTIRILLRNDENNDALPNSGTVFYYTFDETPVEELIPTEITKEDANLIRIVSYNTLFDGLLDAQRVDNFENIVTILHPDIIGFVEAYNTSISTVKSLLDTWIPLGTANGWYVEKQDGEVVASRFPILETWHLTRQFPMLIDLPDNYSSNLVFTLAHLSCCSAESSRQEQADEYAAFILDAKFAGGNVNFPINTPFVYAGDLNLVGSAQPLSTLVNGDIQNTTTYGNGDFLDWDNTPLTDLNTIQSDNRMAYTWRDDSGAYPPGKLDFFIFSDAVLVAEKSFVVQTEVMPTSRLNQYGFDALDTSSASDHFPIVTDFRVSQNVVNTADKDLLAVSIYPNPTSDKIYFKSANSLEYNVTIIDAFGKLILRKNNITNNDILNIHNLSNGIYYLKIQHDNNELVWKKIVKE